MRGPQKGIFDVLGKEIFSREIDEYVLNSEKDKINIIVLGSPDAGELALVNDDIKKRINVITVDMESLKRDLNYEKKFANFSFLHKDVLQLTNRGFLNRFDIIVNRWFIHHLTEGQKQKFYVLMERFLNRSGGIVLVIDWFIPNWKSDNRDSFLKSCLEYYTYHEKLGIAPGIKGGIFRSKGWKNRDFRGGKFTSTRRFEVGTKEAGLSIEKKATIATEIISNPDLFGHYFYLLK